jgi:homoserine dehydrogenase
MPHYNLALLGFGNVGRALAHLLLRKQQELYTRYNLTFAVTGISTARHGSVIDHDGIDLEKALEVVENSPSGNGSGNGHSIRSLSNLAANGNAIRSMDALDFIRSCGADVLFENTPVNYATGEPAVTHLTTALENGMHAITANKGPVVHAYRRLTDLAQAKGLKFYFESTVMDGMPVFSLFRETLPGAQLLSFQGVFNSTTNLILTRMEAGESFEEAVRYAQSIGIAETDPSGDIDGWDAAVKVAALVTVLMDYPLKPDQVDRQGIRGITAEAVRRASQEGKRWKLVCAARREGGSITGKVAPELVDATSPMYMVTGTTSIAQFTTDVLGQLSVIETDPGPETTAYGLLADFLNAVRGEAAK